MTAKKDYAAIADALHRPGRHIQLFRRIIHGYLNLPPFGRRFAVAQVKKDYSAIADAYIARVYRVRCCRTFCGIRQKGEQWPVFTGSVVPEIVTTDKRASSGPQKYPTPYHHPGVNIAHIASNAPRGVFY